MRRMLVVCVVFACGGKDSDSGGTAGSGGSAGAGSATPKPAGSGAPESPPKQEQPCLVGAWDGKDIVNKIRGATASLSKGGLMQTGGAITYEFGPPTDKTGKLVVRADKLVIALSLGQAGLMINGTTTIDGSQTMPYTLGDKNALAIARPTDGKIPVTTVVKTTGLVNTTKTEAGALDLHDDVVFECEGNKLHMWKRSKTGDKIGTKPMLVFARK